MLLIDRILGWVERGPEAPALVWNDQPVSYRLLLAYLSNTVRHLHGQGIGPGLTVGLAMNQGPMHLLALLALARLGALIVPVSPLLRPDDRTVLFRKFAIGTVVADDARKAVEGTRTILMPLMRAHGDEAALDISGFTPNETTPMRISLTSGTTGAPKGVLQTHGSFVLRLDRTECDVVELPRVLPPNLHITTALCLALHALCKGGTIVFPRGYDSAPFFDAVRRHRVTHIGLPPANLAPWLPTLPDGPGFPTIRHLRLIGSTPSTVFLELARRRISPHLFLPYGLAEIGLVSMATPEMILEQPRSSGRPLDGVRLETVDGAGKVLPAGTPGEIRVACDGWPADYHGPDAGDRTRFRDGWFHPGDHGYMSDGLVFVEGRIDDVINVGGRKVSPRFVELVLEEHPAVREAAAFVAEEGIEGSRIAAAIVPSAPIDWKELAQYAKRKLEVRAPVRYYEVETLPRNATGKLSRAGLAQWVAENGRVISRSG